MDYFDGRDIDDGIKLLRTQQIEEESCYQPSLEVYQNNLPSPIFTLDASDIIEERINVPLTFRDIRSTRIIEGVVTGAANAMDLLASVATMVQNKDSANFNIAPFDKDLVQSNPQQQTDQQVIDIIKGCEYSSPTMTILSNSSTSPNTHNLEPTCMRSSTISGPIDRDSIMRCANKIPFYHNTNANVTVNRIRSSQITTAAMNCSAITEYKYTNANADIEVEYDMKDILNLITMNEMNAIVDIMVYDSALDIDDIELNEITSIAPSISMENSEYSEPSISTAPQYSHYCISDSDDEEDVTIQDSTNQAKGYSSFHNTTSSISTASNKHIVNVVEKDIDREPMDNDNTGSSEYYHKLWHQRKYHLEKIAEERAKIRFHRWQRDNRTLEDIIDGSLKEYIDLYESAHALRLQFEAEKSKWTSKMMQLLSSSHSFNHMLIGMQYSELA